MNIEIANRLVQMRKAHGLSQEELANRLGISRQAVSKWERAESSPDTDNLIMLSRLYGVSLDQLLATDDDIPEPEEEKQEAKQGDRVHISFRDGINVVDEDGSRVHVGWDGIHVRESGEDDDMNINDFINDIEVDDEGASFTENGKRVHCSWNSEKNGKRRCVYKRCDEHTGKWRTVIIDEDGRRVVLDTDSEPEGDGEISVSRGFGGFPYAVLVTGVFLLLGFLKQWWHPAWILFLTIPIYYPIASAIRRKHMNWLDIAVPIIVTGAYVALGLIYKLWHPLWLMLLLIPLYYAVSSMLHKGSRGSGIYSLLVCLAYAALGIVFGAPAWKTGWLLFLTIPMFESVAKSIRNRVGIKWIKRFPWELLIIAAYLFVGLMFGRWHPTWIAFLFIPVLRWFVSTIAGRDGNETHIDFDEDEDDDDD